MKVLMLRHAESKGNASGGDYSVKNADSLSSLGEIQAEALGDCLAEWDIDKVIVSPQKRALQTIVPYLHKTRSRAEIWPELAEACWQEERQPPTHSWSPKLTKIPEEIGHYFSFLYGRPIQPAAPETFGNGLRRVYDALRRLEQLLFLKDETILVASHTNFIREMINAMLSTGSEQKVHHGNCHTTLMTYESGWKVNHMNEVP